MSGHGHETADICGIFAGTLSFLMGSFVSVTHGIRGCLRWCQGCKAPSSFTNLACHDGKASEFWVQAFGLKVQGSRAAEYCMRFCR